MFSVLIYIVTSFVARDDTDWKWLGFKDSINPNLDEWLIITNWNESHSRIRPAIFVLRNLSKVRLWRIILQKIK